MYIVQRMCVWADCVVEPVVQVCAAGRGEQRERTPEDSGVLSAGQPLFFSFAYFTVHPCVQCAAVRLVNCC